MFSSQKRYFILLNFEFFSLVFLSRMVSFFCQSCRETLSEWNTIRISVEDVKFNYFTIFFKCLFVIMYFWKLYPYPRSTISSKYFHLNHIKTKTFSRRWLRHSYLFSKLSNFFCSRKTCRNLLIRLGDFVDLENLDGFGSNFKLDAVIRSFYSDRLWFKKRKICRLILIDFLRFCRKRFLFDLILNQIFLKMKNSKLEKTNPLVSTLIESLYLGLKKNIWKNKADRFPSSTSSA